jgi:beta-lactamase regulating signal transducer with metallopeptidase domain
MMLLPLTHSSVSPADSARAVAAVYTASLLATAPIVAAVIGAIALRRASADGRVLVWRAAAVVLLLALVGRALPMRWDGWSVPPFAAAPLIALGRVQVSDLAMRASGSVESVSSGPQWVQIAFVAYALGAIAALLPTILASLRVRGILRRARRVDRDASWLSALDDARAALGIRRAVRLAESSEIGVPVTWGFWSPVVLVPAAATSEWMRERRRMALRHELAHVRTADWAFGIVARFVCALYWFHPGAWWVARSLRRESERAADDRVIASGVARSDYAELLISVSARDDVRQIGAALALCERGSLRTRLAAILDTRRSVQPLTRRWGLVAAAACAVSAMPMSAVELSPTRDVLATLMRDARWESRAYAVIGLAHRADSVAVARSAAELDPSPRVRAWARYALGLRAEVEALPAADQPR